MISRLVHNHIPREQLDLPQFKKFIVKQNKLPNEIIDIDKLPIYI